ncbi:MAG: sulfite exporter TauE/SafE family protein [Thermoguttaceae bacterium]|nr:sulfite exporter TauE/SafE family protein [Thermoguttaceae bacterium]MDW8036486.1 sulfite exporter TauE/SafE family protein [Thermoguttaceae bacterium]
MENLESFGGVLVLAGFFGVACLYAAVGHGGASGYLALMALAEFPAEMLKPTALGLNILVASLGWVQFWRAGFFSWRVFWPLAFSSVPMAFVGGYVQLSSVIFKRLLGGVLLVAALRLAVHPPPERAGRPMPWWAGLAVGGCIGLLSGLTGTGGGIFLTPLLLLAGWANAKPAAALSAAFVWVNSLAGLAGHLTATVRFPGPFPWIALATVSGGLIGSYVGSRWASPQILKRILAAVLLVAAAKLLVTIPPK